MNTIKPGTKVSHREHICAKSEFGTITKVEEGWAYVLWDDGRTDNFPQILLFSHSSKVKIVE